MKKQITSTLSLFAFFLSMVHVFSGDDFPVFGPPSLDVNRVLDRDGRHEAFLYRFGDFLELVEDDSDFEVFPESLEEDVGVFRNMLRSAAAQRLQQLYEDEDVLVESMQAFERLLNEEGADDDLAESMQAFQRLLNEEGMHPSPPPPPPLPLQNVEHVAVQPMRHNPAPIEASSGGSIAEQVVAKQKEMQKRREANANDGNGGTVYENQHNEAIPSQPSDPHMQALFAAIHRRAEIVEEQIVLEHRRLEEEQVNPSSIVIVEITEEERRQLQLLADTIKAQKKLEAEELKRIKALRDGVINDIRAAAPLKKTTLSSVKRKDRSNSFGGSAAPRVEVQAPVSHSLTTPSAMPLHLESDSPDSLGGFIKIERSIEEEEKKEDEPQQPTHTWSWGALNPLNWWRAPATVHVVTPPTTTELIWNEINEIVELISIGLPSNMMDSFNGIGQGLQFYDDIRKAWGEGFHRYLYFPGLIYLIRERYLEATSIIAKDYSLIEAESGGATTLTEMGEALDYIDTIIQGMDVWMQRYSNAVAQQHINPSPQDYLIQEFPHFTDSMRRAFMELKLLYYAKGKAYQGFSVLDVARAHMLDSMKLVETELNAAVQKIEVSRVMNNNNKPMPDDGLDIDN